MLCVMFLEKSLISLELVSLPSDSDSDSDIWLTSDYIIYFVVFKYNIYSEIYVSFMTQYN